jgi:hypothetical protein
MANSKKGVEEEYDSFDSPLSERIKLKEEAAAILRKQLDHSLSSSESMQSELNKQLAQKDKELEALKEIVERKNLEVESLSRSIHAKNDTDSYYVQRLKEALLKKDAANQQIFSSLKQQVDAKDEELRKQESSYSDAMMANERLVRQLNDQLSSAYEQIDQLKNFVANETARSENLSNVFEKSLAEKETALTELQKSKAATSSSPAMAAQIEHLQARLKEKEAAFKNLQIELAKLKFHHDDVTRQLKDKGSVVQDTSEPERQIGVLKMSLFEKESEIKRLEASAFESGKANERVMRQLNAQLKEAYSEIDQLKQFVSSEAVKSSRLEEEFDKQLSDKDTKIAELEQALRAIEKPKTSGKELSELRQFLNVKEQSYALLQADFLKLKAQNISLSKRLESNRKIMAEGEQNFAKLTDEINAQHQQRLRDLITKQTENEAALRSEIEQLKADIKKKDKLIEAETLKVDDALNQFSSKYQQLLKLRNLEGTTSHLEELEKARIEKENMAVLLREAETKLQQAIEREAAVNRREQMLLKEQDAINRQLELLKSAGFEIGRTKEFLKKKLSEVDFEVPAPQSMAAVMEEVPKTQNIRTEKVPQEIRMDIAEPEILPKMEPPKLEKASFFKPKKEEFYNANTYSEIDEIKSIMEIALQSGDSTEVVKKSLIDSGYSKDSIEKALGSMQAIKR